MKLLFARKTERGYVWRVLLDESKLIDGQPDPAFVREEVWSLRIPQGRTEAQYLAMQKRELKAMCQADPRVTGVGAGTVVDTEDATL
jgi:hypothetical protein